MRTVLFTIGAALVAAVFAGGASAQMVGGRATIHIGAINEVAVSGDPGALVINKASGSAGVVDNSTTWSVATNQTSAKVTGALSDEIPTGLTLQVKLSAPQGASSTESALGTTAVDLVTGISTLNASNLGITYTLRALPSAGLVSSRGAVVTYTVTDGV